MTIERVIGPADLRTDDVDVRLLLGLHAYEQGDLPTALAWWEPAAEVGDHRAVVACGKATEETDPRTAADWYRRLTGHRHCWALPAEIALVGEAHRRLADLVDRHPELAPAR